MTQDPIGLVGGLNKYQYATNPISQVDPLGLKKYGKQAESDNEKMDQIFGVGPIDALQAKNDADKATKFAQQSKLEGAHNGAQDAYRHCVWSCLMTQSIGEEQAEIVGDIHEKHGNRQGQPAEEETMDLTNNAVGRKCGLQNDKKDCAERCTDALHGGGLVGYGGGPIQRTK